MAIRLALLGHRVCLVERSAFPRAHVGEALTGDIGQVLEFLGLRDSLPHDAVSKLRETTVCWAESRDERVSPSRSQKGLLVDRGAFDAFLLLEARRSGVEVFQPGRVVKAAYDDKGWRAEISCSTEKRLIRASIFVDATGRQGFFSHQRRRISPSTVALCGYLTGHKCSQSMFVEALSDAWCWGASMPGGQFSAMVFSDTVSLRSLRRQGLEQFWRSQLAKANLFADIALLPLVRPLEARDATTYCAADPVSRSLVRVGDASLSLDPISGTGVEKAMRAGLTAAIILNTMILRPDRTELCVRFYGERHRETVSNHVQWSSEFYSQVKRYSEFPFWKSRSGLPGYREPQERKERQLPGWFRESKLKVRLSDQAKLIEQGCIVGDQISPQMTLVHPSLDRPVAFVEGIAVEELLAVASGSPDVGRLLGLWSIQFSPQCANRVAAWLMQNQILEPIA